MSRTALCRCALLGTLAILAAGVARADGLIVIHDPPPVLPHPPMPPHPPRPRPYPFAPL